MSKNILKCNIPYILNGEFYEIIALDGENVTVRCCHCESRNIYKGSIRSTGNFHMHIKRKHPILLPRVQEVKLNSFLNRRVVSGRRSIGKITSTRMSIDQYNSRKIDMETKVIAQCPLVEFEQTEPQNLSRTPSTLPSNQPKTFSEEVKTEGNHNIIGSPKNSKNISKNTTSLPQDQETKKATEASQEWQKVYWDEVLCRLENLMKGVERELRLRNQIETNRLFMELAKFKFLHPHFSFST